MSDEVAERIAHVVATANYVWDNDEENVQRFLSTPHPLFNHTPPLTVAQSESGEKQVEELLWSIFHGLPA